MRLLKYVMKKDTGLAPNPYFGICSLALCTPNHQNAKLEIGDWILGHLGKAEDYQFVYAMKVTCMPLDMDEYFRKFPSKHPNLHGDAQQRVGDNFYYREEEERWRRLPSAEHNTPKNFQKDQGCPVFLAEGKDNFWYFGEKYLTPELQRFVENFPNEFPGLVRVGRGIEYVTDVELINNFERRLNLLGHKGRCGEPKHLPQAVHPKEGYCIAIDPVPVFLCDAAATNCAQLDSCSQDTRGSSCNC